MQDLREEWDFGDPEGSRKRFEALLEEALEPSLRFEVECQIVRTFSLQRAFERAHEVLDGLAPLLPLVSDRARASFHLERGRTYNSAGEKAKAALEFLEAAKTKEDDYRVDAYHMLAIASSDPSEAEGWNLKALNLSGLSEDPGARRWRASLLNNLGWTFHDSGRFSEALPLFEEAVDVRTAQGDEAQARIAKWCFARCLRSLERYDEAMAIQSELIKAPEAGYASEEMGELLLVTGKPDEARPHFARAYELLSKDKWLAADQPGRLARILDLSVG